MATYPPHDGCSDEALCAMVAGGDRLAEESLVTRHSRLVRVCARPYFLAGGDSEDLIQEGMLGLLKAIREFDPQCGASFRTFAELCIHRRILSAVAAASRDKHAPLNESVSFTLFDGQSEFFAGGRAPDNPEDLLIDREEQRERLERLKGQLSGFEEIILNHYLRGCSYREIASRVGRSEKSVDNAVQRIRRKLARYIASGVCSEG